MISNLFCIRIFVVLQILDILVYDIFHSKVGLTMLL